MRSLKFVITALVTASVALGAAAPAFADPHHRGGPGWGKHHRGHDRVVVIDRRDRGHHGRHYYAPPPPPRKVVVYRDRHHYDRYDRDYHHHHHKRDNTGEIILGVGLGAAALAGVLAATR